MSRLKDNLSCLSVFVLWAGTVVGEAFFGWALVRSEEKGRQD